MLWLEIIFTTGVLHGWSHPAGTILFWLLSLNMMALIFTHVIVHSSGVISFL
jgi:hypothetical protein